MHMHFSNIQGCDPLVPRGCEPKAGIASLDKPKKRQNRFPDPTIKPNI